jgi:pimeloyl-ACP methyl ester carboxylesterase
MKIHVNGVNLYFDVEGLGLRPQGPKMVEKPTLLLLHGGPGADHTLYKPAFSALADVAQVVYLDHRGNGRSDYASTDSWNLSQWADDVHGFCQALGIVRPVVYGASFGGMVAMAYAARYPQHPGKLALVSTAAQPLAHAQARVAMFRQLGGEAAGDLAHRRFVQGDTSPAVLQAWLRVAVPLYTQAPLHPDDWQRGISNPAASWW